MSWHLGRRQARYPSTEAALSSLKEPKTERFYFASRLAVIPRLLLELQSYNIDGSVPLRTPADLVGY